MAPPAAVVSPQEVDDTVAVAEEDDRQQQGKLPPARSVADKFGDELRRMKHLGSSYDSARDKPEKLELLLARLQVSWPRHEKLRSTATAQADSMDRDKTYFLIRHIEGDAFAIYFRFSQEEYDGEVPPYAAVVAALRCHAYGSINAPEEASEDYWSTRLETCKQIGDVQSYNGAFNRIKMFLPHLSSREAYKLYVQGLKKGTKAAVKVEFRDASQRSLAEVQQFAKVYDEAHFEEEKGTLKGNPYAALADRNQPIYPPSRQPPPPPRQQQPWLSGLYCYKCNGRGHEASHCPERPGFWANQRRVN
jgi:hypothetical protein